MAASLNNSAWLEWMSRLMGRGSQPLYAATLPPDHYHCILDELPFHLIPCSALARVDQSRGLEGPWFLNPGCAFSNDSKLPESIASQQDLLSRFAMQGTVAWVTNSATESIL